MKLLRFARRMCFPVSATNSFSLSNDTIKQASNYKRSTLPSIPHSGLVEFKTKIRDDNIPPALIEWKTLRDQLIANNKQISLHNVDAIILSQCNNAKDLAIAKSYIQFLEKEGIQPNFATLGKLLKVYYLAFADSGIFHDDQKDIFKIYQRIREEHDVFDATTCENLIYGLLATDKWKNSVELFDMIKLSASPSISVYSSIISRAFYSNEFELGWKLLKEAVESGKHPKCETYIAYIKSAYKNSQTFVENLEILFEFFGKYEVIITREVVSTLIKHLEDQKHSISFTKLKPNGICKSCGLSMQNISISDEEFDALKSSFLQRVLVRKDVFQKSTPDEVKHFVNFVDKTGPYDCVVDGLNVAFSCGTKKPPKVYVHLLSSVVKYFKRQNKHVLVLGREHMNKWPKEGLGYIKRNASVFFTNNLSHDDPFLLYATIKSGPMTDFFSRDLMRSHAFLLGNELKAIFKRWQQEHQYSLIVATDLGKVVVKEPIRHFKYAQQVKCTWHIPYKENYSPNPAETLDVPDSWLCIKFNK